MVKHELNEKLLELKTDITKFMKAVDYDECEGVDFDDTFDDFEWRIYSGIIESLCDALTDIEFINSPIIAEGYLHKNSQGRYELQDGDYWKYWTSGNFIEVLLPLEEWDGKTAWKWTASTVEHRDGDYYIVRRPDLKMEGLRVRVR